MNYPKDAAGAADGPPWYTSDAIEFLTKYITDSTRILEFGSGRSTVWMSRRTKHIVSIENNKEWYNWVKSVTDVDIRLLQPPQYAEVCDQFADNSFDLIVVDGDDSSRVECVRRSIRLLVPGGVILLDNAERAFYRPAMRRSGQDYSEILELTDGWEVTITNEKPVKQHGNWYTVWWQKP